MTVYASNEEYAVFPHTTGWAIVTNGNMPQLGGYFKTEDVSVALNKWGSIGWSVPGIVLKWEDFTTGIDQKQSGWRITNAGSSVSGKPGLSAVVATRRIETTQNR